MPKTLAFFSLVACLFTLPAFAAGTIQVSCSNPDATFRRFDSSAGYGGPVTTVYIMNGKTLQSAEVTCKLEGEVIIPGAGGASPDGTNAFEMFSALMTLETKNKQPLPGFQLYKLSTPVICLRTWES